MAGRFARLRVWPAHGWATGDRAHEDPILAPFEGRSWRGFHHHATLVLLAFGFLALEQRRAKTRAPPKKSRAHRRP